MLVDTGGVDGTAQRGATRSGNDTTTNEAPEPGDPSDNLRDHSVDEARQIWCRLDCGGGQLAGPESLRARLVVPPDAPERYYRASRLAGGSTWQ